MLPLVDGLGLNKDIEGETMKWEMHMTSSMADHHHHPHNHHVTQTITATTTNRNTLRTNITSHILVATLRHLDHSWINGMAIYHPSCWSRWGLPICVIEMASQSSKRCHFSSGMFYFADAADIVVDGAE